MMRREFNVRAGVGIFMLLTLTGVGIYGVVTNKLSIDQFLAYLSSAGAGGAISWLVKPGEPATSENPPS